MEGLYLHYIHINKCWFYWFDLSPSNKVFRPYVRLEDDYYLVGNPDTMYSLCPFEYNVTKSKAKKSLKNLFPGLDPILTYPYHESPGEGSRPYKDTWAKDNYRKEREFLKQQGGHIWKK